MNVIFLLQVKYGNKADRNVDITAQYKEFYPNKGSETIIKLFKITCQTCAPAMAGKKL